MMISPSKLNTGEVGKINIKQTYVEWEIENFFSRISYQHGNISIVSPYFYFANANRYLQIYPARCFEHNDICWIGVYLTIKELLKEADAPLDITLGIKGAEKYSMSYKNTWFQYKSIQAGGAKFIATKELYLKRQELVPNETLTIFCRASVSSQQKDMTVRSEKTDGLSTLSEDLENMFTNETNYDAEINVKGRTFHVHKLILGSRSPVLSAMFKHDMKEKKNNAINIDDCEPEIFHDFLLFLYSGKAKNLSRKNAVSLYEIADKYLSEDLKQICSNFMEGNLDIDNICEILVLADRYREDQLMKTASEWAKNNLKDLIQTEQWVTFMAENPNLAAQLLKKSLLAK